MKINFQFLQNLPLKRKLMFVVLATCTVTLLLACASLFALQLYQFKQSLARDLRALTEVVAANSTGAVSFGDKAAAAEVLAALKSRPQIVAIGIHLPDGSHWVHVGSEYKRASLDTPIADGTAHFQGRECYIVQPIQLKGETLGTLHVRADFTATYGELIRSCTLILILVLGGSLFVAVIMSTRLQRLVSDPIQRLASVVRTVTVQKDYTIRAQAQGADEVGQLTDAFNDMLNQIQTRDAALNLSQRKLEAMIHSIDGIVWEWHAERNEFTFVSSQSERILGYAPEEWLKNPNFWDERLHPDDAVQAAQTGRDMMARRQPYEYEYRMIAKDGRVVWILESGVVLVESDRPILVRGISLDITQRKTDGELARLNKELVVASRQAGMAEVATGVLHNVGNVLNSVNVSSTLINEKLRNSEVATLVQVGQLLRQHEADISTFLTADSKGKLLPGFITQLADQLGAEQKLLQQEHEKLGRNIEHIKEIVSLQQNYARVSGILEPISLANLLDDALQMNTAGLSRHGVQIVRQYAIVPPATADKHKVIQILVNLVHNAKYALDETNRPDKRITVAIGLNGGNRVKVSITDNGVGIPAENLNRIFSHGFSTRKGGHGFGLHSGANAAKEMGGQLSVHSEGVGKGATFTLELPLAKPKPEPSSPRIVEERSA